MTSAARRASLESSIVQQPRAPERYDCRVARQREVDAGDVVAGVDRARRGDGGVDAAGHRSDDSHRRVLGPPARSTHGADRLDQRRRRRPAVDVCPRVKRSELRALPRRRGPSPAARARAAARRRSRPIRSSTRYRGRRAASAASRPRSPGSQVRVAGQPVPRRRGSPLQVGRRAPLRRPGAPGRRAAPRCGRRARPAA